MKNNLESKKYLYLGVGIVFITILAAIGISYAYWRINLKQTTSNVATSVCFKLTLSDENPISLTNAYPLLDKELVSFYKSSTPYHFTISNVCNTDATAVINLEVLKSANQLSDSYVSVILYNGSKSYSSILTNKTEKTDVYSALGSSRTYDGVNIYENKLTANEVNTEKVLSDSVKAYKLYTVQIKASETKEFNLLEYMDPTTPAISETMNKQFESKITVTASYTVK